MLREMTFFVGGAAVVALGLLVAVGVATSGSVSALATGVLVAGPSVLIGGFFLHVGRQARAYRRAWLRAAEEGRPPPPGGPPG